MAKTRTPKNMSENAILEIIQERLNNLFSKGQGEPPTFLGMHEVEALQARIIDLETKLHKQQPAGGNTSISTVSTDFIIPQPASSVAIDTTAELPRAKPEPGKGGFLPALLRAPKFGNPAKDRIAGLQHSILIGLFVTALFGIGVTLAFWSKSTSDLAISGLWILISEVFLASLAFFWQRRGHVQETSWILVSAMYLVFILGFSITGFSFPIALLLALTVALAGLLLEYYSVIAVTVFSLVTLWVVPYLVVMPIQIKLNELGYTSSIIVLEGLLFAAASRTLKQSFTETDRSTQGLLHANSELQGLTINLEQRVSQRTHDLELAAEVGRTITEKVSNLNEMLKAAVEMICDRFELYYTQLYLTDATGRSIVLRAGAGEVGEKLLQRGHRLSIGSGSLNGRAVAEKKTIIVADTAQSVSFMPNALLPNTRSEMAVPLILAGDVIGVLDLQSEQPGALNAANRAAFEVLAGQLAIAIQNAALFGQAEEARSEVEKQVNRLTERGWQDFLDAIERGQKIGFDFDQAKVVPLRANSPSLASGETFSTPIAVTGTKIGTIELVHEFGRPWAATETELVQATAAQLAQHIDNLRLLAQADRYRDEAEQAVRRLTREGWNALQAQDEIAPGYIYNLNEVKPASTKNDADTGKVIKHPLIVREETIGELAIDSEADSDEDAEIIAAVAVQLSGHIENLRLSRQNEKRAYEMETVAEVSATTSTVLDPERLLQAVVDLTKERFGIYHVHIYLADQDSQTGPEEGLRLAVGAGEVGRKMVAEKHTIALDAEMSLVARAARERQAVIVNDVRSNHDFLANPLLPETRSEMAVPMIVGDRLLGVFDVHSDRLAGFSKEDANIYTTLASQVAVALQNARLYVEQAATVTQLRELDRLKSSFLANMSHELRTPLNSILGFADVILEGLDGPLTENMDNDLGLIQKNGQHLLLLINDVLDMAKIEAGMMNLNPERFKINEILEEVVNIITPLTTGKALSLLIEDNSDHEIQVFADRIRIRQVMINLVNNAMKFTDTGKISICATHQDENLLITVHDTGIGIPADQLEAVFQEFLQVDNSTTRKAGGSGLGLAISRRLIEMHGGRMWAESTGVPGEGSTFNIEMPIEARMTEAVEKQEK